MKLKTHNLFSAGILTAIGIIFTSPVNAVISASIMSVSGNTIIDSFGHRINGKGIPVRTYKTHSLLRSVIYGFMPALIMFAAAKELYQSGIRQIPSNLYWILIQGLFVGPLHLCMDVITEGGIFIKKNGRFQRFAVAHLAYNNPAWNLFFQIAGVAVIALIFYKTGNITRFSRWAD